MIFGTLPGGAPVELFELSSDKLTVRISNYGGRIISVVKDGMDMIVGPKRFEDMLKDTCYCGAICGRVANRIAKGRFSIDGDSRTVAVNNGPNHLHGGIQGFSYKVWTVEELTGSRAVLSLSSPDGEEGYPGSLEVRVTYQLDRSTLSIHYQACSDQDKMSFDDLFEGDVKFYKNAQDFLKRAKEVQAAGKAYAGLDVYKRQ